MPVLIVPGLNGSSDAHWQTLMERRLPDARRVHQQDWDRPSLEAWLHELYSSIRAAPGAVLVAHSLGCSLVAHALARRPDLPIAGAMLVAPADVESESRTPEEVRGFAPLPAARFRCPSIAVASENDPYIAIDRARALAAQWGSEFVNVGRSGHINVASGHGPWPAGDHLLRQLIAKAGAVAADSADRRKRGQRRRRYQVAI